MEEPPRPTILTGFSITAQKFVDLIQIHITLKKQGAFLSGYCPFCYDKKEKSFSVYTHTKNWHCYSCRREGNIYDFIEQTEQLSAQEAILFINSFINHAPNQKPNLHAIRKKIKPVITEEQEKIIISEIDFNFNEQTIESPDVQVSKTKTSDIIPDKAPSYKLDIITDFPPGFHKQREFAIIETETNEVIDSSISQLHDDEVNLFISFINNICKQCKVILGDYQTNSQEMLFQMEFTLKGNKQKLIWLPALYNNRYNAMILSHNNNLEKIFIMKLRDYFKQLES